MSTKSKRKTRRTCRSSTSDSPLPTPSSARRKFKNSIAFEFECEPLQDTSLSSVFTDKDDSLVKNKTSRNRLLRKTTAMENQPEEPDSTTNTISDLEIQDLSKISITKTRKAKKPKKSIFKLPDISNSITSESSDPSEEKVPKKPKKKTIRYTQDLNAFNEDGEKSIASKAKPKKAKKVRLPSFLPPVDFIDEDNITKKSKSSDNLTTDSENKENDSTGESTDTEKKIRKSRRGRSKKTKKKLGSPDDQLPALENNEATSSKISTKSKGNVFNNLHDSINIKSPWSSTSEIDKKVKTPLKRKSALRPSRISKSDTDIPLLAQDIETFEEKELQPIVFDDESNLSNRLSRATSSVGDVSTNSEATKNRNDFSQEENNFGDKSSSGKKQSKGNRSNTSLNTSIHKVVNSKELESNTKNPKSKKSKTKRNTFDVEVKETTSSCEDIGAKTSNHESNNVANESSTSKSSKRGTFNILSNLEDVFREPDTAASPKNRHDEVRNKNDFPQQHDDQSSSGRKQSKGNRSSISLNNSINKVSGEDTNVNSEDFESNTKNPTPRRSKTKRNTFDVEVRETTSSYEDKSNNFVNETSTSKFSKRGTYNISSNLEDVFRQPDGVVSPRKRLTASTSLHAGFTASETISNSSQSSTRITPRKSARASKVVAKDELFDGAEVKTVKLSREDTFEMEAKEKTDNDNKISNDESNIVVNETSAIKSSKRGTYNILSNLEDVFRQPDGVVSPRKMLTSSTSLQAGFRASETISNPSQNSTRVTPRKSARAFKIVAKGDSTDGAEVKTLKLKREGTFEVAGSSQKQKVGDISGLTVTSRRETYVDDDKSIINLTESIIDLTDSRTYESDPSPRKKMKRSTYDKETSGSGKSSFEVSFKVRKGEKSSEEILDHLNITRRDSRKSSFKKSGSAGIMRPSASDDEDFKRGNFVTMRRGCQTMVDLSETGDGFRKGGDKLSWNSVVKSSSGGAAQSPSKPGTAKNLAPKKSIRKKTDVAGGGSKRRDTFEVAEIFYEALENGKQTQYKPAVPIIIESTPGKTTQSRDAFDLIKNTPTAKLDKMMLDGESCLLSESILDDSNQTIGSSRLTRLSIFTNKEGAIDTPQPRKSNRKRWSQVERTPIFEKMPRGTPSTSKADLQTTLNKSNNLSITTRNMTANLSTIRADTTKKEKKSVKIETPLKTPKIRLHSPLAMRKTPRPAFSGANDSILSGNCAGPSKTFSPPSGTSTPYHKKKEVSLLQKVLTSEKSKTDKILGKNSTKKMPNFAKIHQRHFSQMENIQEMQERKAVRAQFLLSGNKPPPITDASSRTEDKESRKQLKFSPARLEPSTTAKNIKEISKPVKKMLEKQKKRASLEKKKKQATKSKVPVPVAVAIKPPAVVVSTKIEKPKNVTRFGFKLPKGKENVTKDEQIKAVTSKSKVAGNTTERNRNIQGNVRTNRRFELLMKMRQNQKQAVKLALAKEAKKNIRTNIPHGLVKTGLVKDNKSSKLLSKPLQQMLNRKAALEKEKKKKTNEEKNAKSKIPVRILSRPRINKNKEEELRRFNRFGFKLPIGKENVTKIDQIKAVLTKSRIPSNRTEENRREMGRVRSNRRFELLMSLRERNV